MGQLGLGVFREGLASVSEPNVLVGHRSEEGRGEGEADEEPPTQGGLKVAADGPGPPPPSRWPPGPPGARGLFQVWTGRRREGAPRLRAGGACREPYTGCTLCSPLMVCRPGAGAPGKALQTQGLPPFVPQTQSQVLDGPGLALPSRNPDCPKGWGNPGSLPPGGSV